MTSRGRVVGRHQDGAALVEFAFVLLPLLFLTIGTLLYGLVFVSQQAMSFVAQRGADALVQLDPHQFPSLDALCSQNAKHGIADEVAKARVDSLLPDIGLLKAPDVAATKTNPADSTTVEADRKGVEGCFVSVEVDFPVRVPLLPLPDRLRGVGFVPIETQ